MWKVGPLQRVLRMCAVRGRSGPAMTTTDYASEWIARAQSLTQVHPFPLGVSIASHMDMLLRDTRQDLLVASGALEAVLALHHETPIYELDPTNGTWVYVNDERVVMERVCVECSDISTLEDIGDGMYQEGVGVLWPCPTVQAITAALGIETGSNHE